MRESWWGETRLAKGQDIYADERCLVLALTQIVTVTRLNASKNEDNVSVICSARLESYTCGENLLSDVQE